MLTSLPLDNGARCRATRCTSAATYLLNRAWCSGEVAPTLHLARDTIEGGDLPELMMSFARVYKTDMFASAGRDLTIARLAEDLRVARETALEEMQ